MPVLRDTGRFSFLRMLCSMSGTSPRHILLIGLRGSGKSTLARMLASRLGCAAADLDDVTPRVMGERVVAEAFRKHGEAAFRAAEVRALREVLGSASRLVIALGGGTPMAPGAGELIRAEQAAGRAVVVYLRADAATLRARLIAADNAHRPSLTGKGVLEEIEEVLSRRDPVYAAMADAVVYVDQMDAEGACGEIEKRVM